MKTTELINKLKIGLKNGKFNGKIYANNTIYISGEKIENIDLIDLFNAYKTIYRENLEEKFRNNFDELTSYIDLSNLNSETFESKKYRISTCLNWSKGGIFGTDYKTLKELYNEEIK
ncbi:MAG: hypothetical protein PHX80_05225 [Candidatus Nanoarchaeia archaeon]|nr:hypothetical protein [Candidatus Nanoarchaeia archaeon]